MIKLKGTSKNRLWPLALLPVQDRGILQGSQRPQAIFRGALKTFEEDYNGNIRGHKTTPRRKVV